MAIRLQDIASDLNLSKMTISKVLRGQTDVSAETKARVMKRVNELNYRPNATARSLRTGQTYSAGLVVRSMDDPAVPAIIRGMNEVLRAEGYSLIVSSADGDPAMVEREAELQLSRQVDLLFFHLQGETVSSLASLPAGATPVIYVEQQGQQAQQTQHAQQEQHPSPGLCIGLREHHIGQLAVQHLVLSGATRIAYLRGPRTAAADERFAGFLHGMREAAIPIRQQWIAEGELGPGQYRSGSAFAEKLFAARLPAARATPDAVIAYTDRMALGVCDSALSLGWRIPAQLQVIGCGNEEALCAMRSLTSIDLAREESGRRAARLGLKLIRQSATQVSGARPAVTPRATFVSPRIVQRGSTFGKRTAVAGRPAEAGNRA